MRSELLKLIRTQAMGPQRKLNSHEKAALSGRWLARSAVLNLLGQGAPLLVALLVIPILIGRLGVERFGVIGIAWVVIGYFSLFDLGLGRVLTKIVAEKIGGNKASEIPAAVCTGLALMAIFGMIGGLLVAALSPWLVQTALKIPLQLQTESLYSFYVLAATIPLVVVSSGLRGVLEAYLRFPSINLVRGISSAYTFAGPLLVLPFSNNLAAIVCVLSLGRLVTCVVYWKLCARIAPDAFRKFSFRSDLVPGLLAFGGWITVSNVVGPLMVYLDRFVIGAAIGVAAVTYYVVPYELATKLWLIPGALLGALFPAFAASLQADRAHAVKLFKQGAWVIFVSMFPICVVIITFAHEALGLWLGSQFADQSAAVLQWLAIGVLVNSLAQMPFAFIQSAGRADITAKLHLLQLPFYLACLWWLLSEFGIGGAAVAWAIRAMIDAALLSYCLHLIVPETLAGMLRGTIFAVASIMVLIGAALLVGIWHKVAYAIAANSLFFISLAYLYRTRNRKNHLIDVPGTL